MAQGQRDAAAQAVEYLARLGKPTHRARVLVMGTGCEGHCRLGQSCVIRSLRGVGALVDFYDPNLPEALCEGMRARGVSRPTSAVLHRYDMVILQQPCSPEDYRRATAAAHCLLDARPTQGDCII